jgi:DNA adenine methylase
MVRPRKIHPPIDTSFEDVLTAIADENMPTIQAAEARPFLKWVGGKRSVLPELAVRMPDSYGTYRELFLGGGALFFNQKPAKAYLADVNFYLVLTYRAVRDDVEHLTTHLRHFKERHGKEFFAKARKKIARETDTTKVGALLIYLNKTCYNGLYRVNRAGEFNVPIGSYDDPTILDADNLWACSKSLHGVEIFQHPFEQAPVVAGDFYYLDPPYHKTFSSFDSSGFHDDDHRRLAEFCKRLDAAKCLFMVSNSDTPFIRKLYNDFHIEEVKAGRFVSCKGEQRVKETELIIRNYSTVRAERTQGQTNGQSA